MSDAAVFSMMDSGARSPSPPAVTTPPLFPNTLPSKQPSLSSSSSAPSSVQAIRSSSIHHSYFSFKDVGIFEPLALSSEDLEDHDFSSGADSPLITTPGTISPSFTLNLPSLSSISSLPSLFYNASTTRTSAKSSTPTTGPSSCNFTATTVCEANLPIQRATTSRNDQDREQLRKVIQNRLGKIQRPQPEPVRLESTNPSMLLMRRSQSLRNSYTRSDSTSTPDDIDSGETLRRQDKTTSCVSVSPRKRMSRLRSQTRRHTEYTGETITQAQLQDYAMQQTRLALSPISDSTSKKHSRSLSSLLTSWFSPTDQATSLQGQQARSTNNVSPSRKQPKILTDLAIDVKSRPCSPVLGDVFDNRLDPDRQSHSRQSFSQSRGRRRIQRPEVDRAKSTAANSLRQIAL